MPPNENVAECAKRHWNIADETRWIAKHDKLQPMSWK